MITKKAFATTSKFLITAALLSQAYSFASIRLQSRIINYSALINLAENVKAISTSSVPNLITKEDTIITHEIINVIDKEIRKKIINTRYVINTSRPETKVITKKIIAKSESKKIIKSVEVSKSIVDQELSIYEINNQSLINLNALSVEEVTYSKFETINLAATYNAEIKDEVAMAQSSTEQELIQADEVKLVQPSLEKDENQNEDEMTMFEYSDKSESALPAKTMDQKLYERPLSNTVKKAITREIAREMEGTSVKRIERMSTQKASKTTKIDNQEIDLESQQNTIYEYADDAVQRTDSSTRETEDAINAFAALAKTQHQADVSFVIRAKEINLSTHKNFQAHAFEFIPDYERSERSDDQTSGEITLGYPLNSAMNIQTGVIQSQGVISTRVELNLGSSKGIEIPLINEEGMQQFLQKQSLSIEGNLILLAIDPSILDTEIDSQFAQRFYFDKNFTPLESNSGTGYVLYAGVKSGNIMIRYLLNNKETAQKIIYVGDGEMYFEDPEFSSGVRETYTFTTRNLLGQKRKELIINGDAISFFNTNILAKKKALNAYEIRIPPQASGMRKYLEFKHLNDGIFVGSSSEKEIEIPGNDFIGKILDMNQISSLKDRCIVQINLSKDVREMKVGGKNRSGEMFVESSFLDKDGNFSRDSEMSEKVFIVGDQEGLFSVRLDYTDGSTEFLKTFCSEGTYLVEQL